MEGKREGRRIAPAVLVAPIRTTFGSRIARDFVAELRCCENETSKTNCYMVHQPGSPEPSDLTVMEKEFFRFFGSQPLQISVAACFPRFGEGALCQTDAHKSDQTDAHKSDG